MQKAYRSEPLWLASYSDFAANDRHILEHYGDRVPLLPLESAYWRDGLHEVFGESPEVVGTVCPCAGLSQTSARSSNHGPGSTHNRWMYQSAEWVLEKVKPRVMFGENAPALFGPKGRPVAAELAKIGRRHGYSFSMVYTDTQLHGIPQRRQRTFYFFWKAKRAPMCPGLGVRREISVADFMREVSYGDNPALERMEYGRTPLTEDIYFLFALEKWGEAWRSECDGRTVLEQLRKDDQLDQLFQWADAHAKGHQQYQEVDKHRKLIAAGRGIYDESPKVVSRATPAVMFKNIKRIVHPYEDRFLNVRELMSLMGFPSSFQLYVDPNKKESTAIDAAMHHISQNVPVTTAADMASYIGAVLNREIPLSDSDYYLYDNVKRLRLLTNHEIDFDDEDGGGE